MDRPKETPPVIQSLNLSKTFEILVEVDGVPFIFEGGVSDKPKNVVLSLRMPMDEIQRLESSDISIPDEMKIDGVVGFVGGMPAGNEQADLFITRIRSYSEVLTKDHKYQDVHVGRFLMNGLLAIADKKDWRLSVISGIDAGHSRLSSDEMLNWFTRKGFEFDGSSTGIRQPKKSSEEHPVLNALES